MDWNNPDAYGFEDDYYFESGVYWRDIKKDPAEIDKEIARWNPDFKTEGPNLMKGRKAYFFSFIQLEQKKQEERVQQAKQNREQKARSLSHKEFMNETIDKSSYNDYHDRKRIIQRNDGNMGCAIMILAIVIIISAIIYCDTKNHDHWYNRHEGIIEKIHNSIFND